MYKIMLFVIAFFLVGCAPKYVVKNQYIPSQNDGFLQCVSIYEDEKKICEQNCRDDYQLCLDAAYSRAEDVYASELNKYNADYSKYLFELKFFKIRKYKFKKKYESLQRDYKYFAKECNKKKQGFTCKRKNELLYSMKNMKKNILIRPRMPQKPFFNTILKSQQSFCVSNCSCSKNFDIGYKNCGGQIISHKYCIENCD